MNASKLFDFVESFTEKDFKDVEKVFANECLGKTFKEFKTFLGGESKDYLSYLVAASLIDGIIENDASGYMKFLSIASAYSQSHFSDMAYSVSNDSAENFFQVTIYHAYNLSLFNNKEEVFDGLVQVASDILDQPNFTKGNFKNLSFLENIDELVEDVKEDRQYYFLFDYQEHHKRLESYLLQVKLEKQLDVRNTSKNAPKV